MQIKLSARNPQNLLNAKASLLNDGWSQNGDTFFNHGIKTQQEIRQRLHSLGLLISKTVNIHIEARNDKHLPSHMG